MRLIADSREPQSYIDKLEHAGFTVVTMMLDQCDYVFMDGELGIERKSAPDLLASIKDGRLGEQIDRMYDTVRLPVVLVHGTLYRTKNDTVKADDRYTKFYWKSLQKVLWTVQARGGIIQFCKTSEFTDNIRWLCEWSLQEHKLTVKRHFTPLKLDPHVEFLTGLPNVGVVTATSLLDYAGTTAQAMSAVTYDNTKDSVKGVGPKTIGNLRKFLQLAEDERLAVVTDD